MASSRLLFVLPLALALLSTPHLASAASLRVLAPTPVVVTLNLSAIIHTTDARYVSANFDWHLNYEETPAWINSSIMNLNLSNPNLLSLASALSPAVLRISGSEADDAFYESPGSPCPPPPVGNFCMTMQRWVEVQAFAEAVGWDVAFGLNAMIGRPNASTRQNLSSITRFLTWVASSPTPRLTHLEYGNELEHAVDAGVYAADVQALRGVIDATWPDAAVRPKLVANDENPDPRYWGTLLPAAGSAMDVASWHLYIGYGLNPDLKNEAWNASFLAGIHNTAAPMVAAADAAGFTRVAGHQLWVGETAMAWHSGQNGTTNTFLSGPWYVTQLGTLAATHHVQCRQTLVGGFYELINKWDMTPNPDWWTAALWKRVMGVDVFPIPGASDPDVLVFAHCAAAGAQAPAGAVAVAYVNLNANETKSVTLAGSVPATPRDEYMLTAVGSESSRAIALNGAPLLFTGPGEMSALTPVHVPAGGNASILLPPHSYGYFVLYAAAAVVCG